MGDIRNATLELYEAFRGYPLKPRIKGCPHCELEQAERSLHSHPLHHLTWPDFGVYPFKAMTTFGDVDDFKHFLPRILELYVLDPDGARYDADVVVGKLQYASWRAWPAPEAKAVREFVQCWLQTLESRSEGTADELRSALAERGFSGGDAV